MLTRVTWLVICSVVSLVVPLVGAADIPNCENCTAEANNCGRFTIAPGGGENLYDPQIPQAPTMRSWPDLPPMRSVQLDPETIRSQDAIVIVTDQSAVDYEMLAAQAPLIIDTRGIYRAPRPNVVKA